MGEEGGGRNSTGPYCTDYHSEINSSWSESTIPDLNGEKSKPNSLIACAPRILAHNNGLGPIRWQMVQRSKVS